MAVSFDATEQDQTLINALQVSPRATWVTLSRVLGVSAETLERRWVRLSSSGQAWVSAAPGSRLATDACLAYVGVSCAPAQTATVAQSLAQEPEVLSVEVTTGRYDLLLTVSTPDLPSMTRFLIERIDIVAGVLKTHAMLSTAIFKVGTEWRLQSLSNDQVQQLTLAERMSTWQGLSSLTELDRTLRDALIADGRLTASELARRTGVSRNTAQRRMDWMIRSGAIGIRCEIAGAAFGWHVSASFGVEVPPDELVTVCRGIARSRHVRLVASVADRPNVIVTAWLRSLGELPGFEAGLVKTFPAIRIRDRYVNLYAAKRMTRLLKPDGSATGYVLPPSTIYTS